MVEWKTILQALSEITAVPILLVFAVVFIMGYMLKNYTKLNNKLIPWFLMVIGILAALLFLGLTAANGVIGMIVAWLTMAFYEQIRNTIQYLVLKKEDK